MSEIHFGNTVKIPCITSSECKEKPEDIFEVRGLSYNYGHVIALRTSNPRRIYFVLCKKKPVCKRMMQGVFFSHYSNIDFVSVHWNIFPMLYQKYFDESITCISDDFLILNACELLERIHNRYEAEKLINDDITQPHLNYIRYKLECMILTMMNMQSNRPKLFNGKNELKFGLTVDVYHESKS